MPHVVVKLWPGKSEKQKIRLAEEIVKDVMTVLHYGEESVSLAIEEVKQKEEGSFESLGDEPRRRETQDLFAHCLALAVEGGPVDQLLLRHAPVHIRRNAPCHWLTGPCRSISCNHSLQGTGLGDVA